MMQEKLCEEIRRTNQESLPLTRIQLFTESSLFLVPTPKLATIAVLNYSEKEF